MKHLTPKTNPDFNFRITPISWTHDPELVAWLAMHQCYSESDCEYGYHPKNYGESVVKNLLKGHKGHYSPLEHNTITVNAVGFPHSMMQQLTRHRIGVAFSVQSGRYTGHRILACANNEIPIEDVLYVRPVGKYPSRDGMFDYTETHRRVNILDARSYLKQYAENVNRGMSFEQARGLFPFDFRQNFVMSANVRSLMHILDMRAKKDAQLEIQMFSAMMMDLFNEWCPNVANWYEENRLGKARLSP